ncbi:hypothetical protein B0E42_05400 [Pseudomonas sp. A25(2017)]|nr:hypothetical protein B0E42_05400 [Pseudomonas sp. A25(2017)]
MHRFREQARSHSGFVVFGGLVSNPFPCGSEPARDGARSVTVFLTDAPLSRASSLPQVKSPHTAILARRRPRLYCPTFQVPEVLL